MRISAACRAVSPAASRTPTASTTLATSSARAIDRSGWTAFLHSDAEGLLDLNARIPLADRSKQMQAGLAINNAGANPGRLRRRQRLRRRAADAGQSRADAGDHRARGQSAVLSHFDGHMVPVSVQPTVTDVYDPAPACRIATVINTDHLSGGVDPDVVITGPLTVNLSASARSHVARNPLRHRGQLLEQLRQVDAVGDGVTVRRNHQARSLHVEDGAEPSSRCLPTGLIRRFSFGPCWLLSKLTIDRPNVGTPSTSVNR